MRKFDVLILTLIGMLVSVALLVQKKDTREPAQNDRDADSAGEFPGGG